MEKLLNMLNIFAWIFVLGCPLMIAITFRWEGKYKNSLSQQLDRLQGIEKTYVAYTLWFALLFVISLVYLIA